MKQYIPEEWPPKSSVEKLLAKSSGQFIYASTVIKSISSLHVSPVRQLDVLLGLLPARSGVLPFSELDACYTHILSSVQDKQLMLDILAILMNCFDLENARRPVDISAFLGVELEDVEIVLSSLASITVVTVSGRVHISHASLADFLADQTRSQSFHIDSMAYASSLAQKGLMWLSLKSRGCLNSSASSKNMIPQLNLPTIFKGGIYFTENVRGLVPIPRVLASGTGVAYIVLKGPENG